MTESIVELAENVPFLVFKPCVTKVFSLQIHLYL